MSKTDAREFILFRSGEFGPDLPVAAAKVEAAADVSLVRRYRSALLIQGAPDSVQRLTLSLPGWETELNQAVRGGV
jgi:hypothetical protein